MEPRIETLTERKLVGKRLTMSLADNRTGELWRSFMPRRKEIQNPVSAPLYSMQIYSSSYFNSFSPINRFEKWAALEVADFASVPDDMETYTLQSGLYAVFYYKGLSTDSAIFRYIFNSWLPSSSYNLDERPHFEILGEKYKNEDPESEEDIWIPIKTKR